MKDLVVSDRAMSKQELIAQKRLIQEVMESVMKEGTHYGIIPGCKQPSLLKAGSESILSTFRIAVDPIVEDLSGPDVFRYRITVRGILPSGVVVGAGVGEASTDEEKYRWRSAVCAEEFDATPEDRRRVKWFKPYGKDAYSVKQVRTNPADLENTVLKMAKKRAQVDLALTATGASDVFAQDIEDLPPEIRESIVGDQKQSTRGKPEVKEPEAKKAGKKQAGTINESQKNLLLARLSSAGISEKDFCAFYQIKAVENLPFDQMNPALEAIKKKSITIDAEFETGGEPGEDKICKECGEVGGHLISCPDAVPE